LFPFVFFFFFLSSVVPPHRSPLLYHHAAIDHDGTRNRGAAHCARYRRSKPYHAVRQIKYTQTESGRAAPSVSHAGWQLLLIRARRISSAAVCARRSALGVTGVARRGAACIVAGRPGALAAIGSDVRPAVRSPSRRLHYCCTTFSRCSTSAGRQLSATQFSSGALVCAAAALRCLSVLCARLSLLLWFLLTRIGFVASRLAGLVAMLLSPSPPASSLSRVQALGLSQRTFSQARLALQAAPVEAKKAEAAAPAATEAVAAAPASFSDVVARYGGWYPFLGLAGVIAVSKEVLILNEEFLLVSNFAAMAATLYFGLGDTITKVRAIHDDTAMLRAYGRCARRRHDLEWEMRSTGDSEFDPNSPRLCDF